MSDWTSWLEILLDSALLAGAFIATYEGARRLALGGLSRWPALLLAAGLVIPVYEASASLEVPGRVRVQSLEQASMRAAEPPGGWEKAPMSPQDRAMLSANAAMINFLVLGKRGELIDANGNRVPFNPTQEQLRTRETLVRDEKGAEDTGQQFLERGVRLFASAFLFMTIGFAIGWRQRIVHRRTA